MIVGIQPADRVSLFEGPFAMFRQKRLSCDQRAFSGEFGKSRPTGDAQDSQSCAVQDVQHNLSRRAIFKSLKVSDLWDFLCVFKRWSHLGTFLYTPRLIIVFVL